MKTLKVAQIILALDFDSEVETLNLVEKLEPALCKLKIGKQLFVREGPKVIKKLKDKGFDVFLDLKFHDIPNTVVKACEAATDMGCWMVTIHASGGIKMMEAVTSSFARLESPPLLVAVTILTSLDGYEMEKAGFSKSIDILNSLDSLKAWKLLISIIVEKPNALNSFLKYNYFLNFVFFFLALQISFELDTKSL